ncbi:phosphoribosylglycinamide formyltransferase [Anaerorhabdus furcosa]|uniref:Phosphoribosylglycinamide formyltransferase n=1 Tax=Anaerorhabdus furcosa TaxID=118967 RepID=A0A1T4N3T6_9FIRM|nr:phosphoribosylglycinamide formyltransferase [Anaerorhabdus furcosa]SJZ73685.1 phosphoribosylglycinamide formyltransferase-1 [Anaerorhabdus furcosa]
MRKIAVFASGTGTNFDAIQASIEEGKLNASIELVVVDKSDALVIEKAKAKHIDTFVFNPKSYATKNDYEREIVSECKKRNVEWIVLAGYMRILADCLLEAYPNRIVNIHPSLLPAFKGKDAIGQAFHYGVKLMGVSIHYVNAEMDGGKIIAQKCFDVLDGMTHEDAEREIHKIEHQLYPETLRKLLEENEDEKSVS